jgi:hypothetical protein
LNERSHTGNVRLSGRSGVRIIRFGGNNVLTIQ